MDDVKSGYRKAVFLWLAMVFSVFIYALVVESMRWNPVFFGITSTVPEAEIIRYAFFFLAISGFFLIRFVRHQLLFGKVGRNTGFSKSPFLPIPTRLITASIVTFVICESVAIYGLALFFLTRGPFDFYLFMVLSLFYFAFFFPRYAQWEELVWEMRGKERSEALV